MKIKLVVSLVLVVVLGVLVWATRYQHLRASLGTDHEMIVRFERYGWNAWVLTRSGWRQISYDEQLNIPPPLVLQALTVVRGRRMQLGRSAQERRRSQ